MELFGRAGFLSNDLLSLPAELAAKLKGLLTYRSCARRPRLWLAIELAPILIEKLTSRHFERLRDLMEHGDSRIADAPFHAGNVGAMEATLVSKFFLRPAFCLSKFADVLTNAAADIHAASASQDGRSIYRR